MSAWADTYHVGSNFAGKSINSGCWCFLGQTCLASENIARPQFTHLCCDMQHRKNVTLRLLILVYALALLTACVPPLTSLVVPTPTCSGGWGPYIGKDMPGWTSAWKAAFSETNLEAKDVKVQGVGETWISVCNGKTTESWGMAYAEIQATIIVDDVKNPDSLGSTIAKVYQAVKTLTTNEKDLAKANLAILFVSRKDANEVTRRNCNYQQGIPMIEQGKSGKELFEATCSK